ncbi:casein kinase ii subunit beta [Anaeramoeba ignava]|uniref:Casein kinase II subunit beta n=1 Tax=Anaeramoeba ignava TaxID=1746090 RepID=A0A9Q0LVI9_ANAIG|nr:casein kinase ii subunit beta [Anaeramoeba ignava]|eukprot:Anaeramoba_ignava/a365420_36.p1 GENE.a365420_36~~a365420_36.p1  ORF type:complete len:221 (-),score=65.57 a365420_36:109-771(-)
MAQDNRPRSKNQNQEDENVSWVTWFCSLKGNEFLCEVEESFIADNFNLTGLSSCVPYYKYALQTIKDVDSPELDQLTEEQEEVVESAAEMLYGLIHARYIITTPGMQLMTTKYQNGEFGRCPRVFCEKQPCLPVGLSDNVRQDTVKLFCPRCEKLYVPKLLRHASMDGAYFGTTFAHFLLHSQPELQPPLPTHRYVPKIFGFKIHVPEKDSEKPTIKNLK